MFIFKQGVTRYSGMDIVGVTIIAITGIRTYIQILTMH